MVKRNNSITVAVLILFVIVMQPRAFGNSKVFRGKIIDFDTKRPLEGAVVVAIWFDPVGHPSTKDLKEALTDNNGEWSIAGEGGNSCRLHPLPSFLQPIPFFMSAMSYLRSDFNEPQFMIFKPGYEDFQEFRGGSYGLLAYPHVDRKQGLEGIILSVNDNEERYSKSFSQEKAFEVAKGYV